MTPVWKPYADLGWPVFPVSRTKQPIVSRGVYAASTDPVVLARYFFVSANIAVACGQPIGAIVIDVDRRNGGYETLSKIPELPRTVEASTGGAGAHYYFKLPTLGDGSRLRGKLGQGIDILSTGRYALVPPSIHESGLTYDWVRAPWDHEIANLPDELLQFCLDKPETCIMVDMTGDNYARALERAARYAAATPGAVSGQGGHNTTIRLADRLLNGFALDARDALDLLVEWNRKCEPPWTLPELRHKIRQAYIRGRTPRGSMLLR